jgi:hypothetical protein
MPLSTAQRWFYGCLGGLCAFIIMAASLNFDTWDSFATELHDPLHVVGIAIRLVACTFLGGLAVWLFLSANESNKGQAFGLGISAPALFSTFLAGSGNAVLSTKHSELLLIPRAVAATIPGPPPIYDMCLPRRSETTRIIGGIFGRSTSTLPLFWFVTKPLQTKADALAAFSAYSSIASQKDYKPKIFAIPGNDAPDHQFIVAIEINLSGDDVAEAHSANWSQFQYPVTTTSLTDLLKKNNIDPSTLDTCHFI